MVTVFLPYVGYEHSNTTVMQLKKIDLIDKIYLLSTEPSLKKIDNTEIINVDYINSSKTMDIISTYSKSEYTLIFTQDNQFDFGQFFVERFYQVAKDTNSDLVYSDYYEIKNGKKAQHPLIDFQIGSIRDDFKFGYVLYISNKLLKEYSNRKSNYYKYAGLYELKLMASKNNSIVRIPEYLYTTNEPDIRKTGAKQFDYVDPKNRDVQSEMEIVATNHLKEINAYLKPEFKYVEFNESQFEYEASVIIPVKNRANTISDAIKSVLSQKTNFSFNLIIVDNYSDDGTTEIIKAFAEKDNKVIHIIPERNDLGIGGCWNEAVHSKYCGKFAIQLDSDDIYSDENTVQTVVNTFYEENCAMVVGTYKMTNFALEEIPPGIIDHKEWTPENGRNNALRINGLGAPRAFYTPILRNIKVPNVSYGEDYALGLMISRYYQVGRIYHPIYLCRRWEGNSDAELDVIKYNSYNLYKDRIRTIEILSRQNLNKK